MQFKLGACSAYKHDRGVSLGRFEAARWYHLPTDATARFNLGMCFTHCTGAVQDAAEAIRWFRLATDHGDIRGLDCIAQLGL